MNEQEKKRYWRQRLAAPDLRAGWLSDIERLGLFSDPRAFGTDEKIDMLQTMALIGTRLAAVLEFDEARKLVPELVALTWSEHFAPFARKEQENDDNAG